MPTEIYRLPNLLTLLPKKLGGEINPHFKEVDTKFNAWLEATFIGRLAEDVHKNDIPLLASLIYPSASREQSMGGIKFLTAALMLENLSERIPNKQLTVLAQLGIKILCGGKNNLTEVADSGLTFSVEAAVGSFHWPQLIKLQEKMAAHLVTEAHSRETSTKTNTARDIQSYMARHQFTVVTRPCFVFVQSIRCLYIPDDVLANPVVQEMEEAAAEMLLISSDIFSFKMECARDRAFVNLLTVMQKDPETAHLDFQKRLDYAGELFKATLERFEVCRQNLPSINPKMDQYLALYADGLLDVVIGNVQWSLVCRRYSVFASEEDRRNNILRLASELEEHHQQRSTFCTIFLLLLLFSSVLFFLMCYFIILNKFPEAA